MSSKIIEFPVEHNLSNQEVVDLIKLLPQYQKFPHFPFNIKKINSVLKFYNEVRLSIPYPYKDTPFNTIVALYYAILYLKKVRKTYAKVFTDTIEIDEMMQLVIRSFDDLCRSNNVSLSLEDFEA